MLDQRLNDARKVPEDQQGLRNVMNRVDAEITVQVEGLRREFDSKEGKVVALDVEKEPEKSRAVINMASGAERAGYDFISARVNLWFFSQLYGIPTEEAHRRINELSDMLGLQSYLDRKFYALSTGYKQRVTLVRAFINDPKVVFLDEPTIGLDVMTALSIREYILKQAKQHGRTI